MLELHFAVVKKRPKPLLIIKTVLYTKNRDGQV